MTLENYTGHSKGRWLIAEYSQCHSPVVSHYGIKGNNGKTIALIDCSSVDGNEAFANARLLAAAPALLAERNRLAAIVTGILKEFRINELSRPCFHDALEWKNRPAIQVCVDCGLNTPELGLVCDECKADAMFD